MGDSDFKERLLQRMDQILSAKKRTSFSGAVMAEKAVFDVEKALNRGLEMLGMGEDSLGDLPKGETRKLVLAWWLRKHSTVSRAWIAERLRMGHENRVTLAVREVHQSKAGQMGRWKRHLEKLLLEIRRSNN